MRQRFAPRMKKHCFDLGGGGGGEPSSSENSHDEDLNDEELRPLEPRSETATASESVKTWIISNNNNCWKPLRNWAIFYVLTWSLMLVCLESATMVAEMTAWMLKMVCWFCFMGFIAERKTAWRSVSKWCTFLWPMFLLWNWQTTVRVTTGSFHVLRARPPVFETVLYELQHERQVPSLQTRPLQALGLGNGYLQELAEALTVHFDRYGRNETERSPDVADLNLIANVFDDSGVVALVEALQHPFAYTNMLLLGRNKNIGDSTAEQLAHLIESRRHLPVSVAVSATESTLPAGQNLTWLSLGSTSMTARGMDLLYRASGTRPFEYLGFDYTDQGVVSYILPSRPFQLLRRLNRRFYPVFESLPRLHQATYLQEIGLTGNALCDDDMEILTKNVLQTRLSDVNLFNNKIGPRGLEHLLPLITANGTGQLEELNLGFNDRIGDEGAILLAEALKATPNSTLKTLTLSSCHVGQRGAEAFLSIFPQNTHLTYLGLVGNKDSGSIRIETLQALGKATSANYKH